MRTRLKINYQFWQLFGFWCVGLNISPACRVQDGDTNTVSYLCLGE